MIMPFVMTFLFGFLAGFWTLIVLLSWEARDE